MDARGAPRRSRAHSHGLGRSEEHTSELQSRSDLVCRLLLEKKKIKQVEGGIRSKRCTREPDTTATKSSTKISHLRVYRTRNSETDSPGTANPPRLAHLCEIH